MTEATNFQVNYSCVVTIDKPEIETLSPFYSGTHISQSLGEIAANMPNVELAKKPEIETLSPFYSGTHISQSLGEIAANMPNVELAKQIRASQPVLSKYSFIPNGQSKVPA
jgi:hypothetical protein